MGPEALKGATQEFSREFKLDLVNIILGVHQLPKLLGI
jgi:hypothetical protein